MMKVSEIPTCCGVYRFTNTVNEKIYVGSAKNLRKRFVQHMSNLRLNKHHSKHFQAAWNKYGKDAFVYEIIEFVEDISILLTREQYYLDTLLFAQEYINGESNKFLELGYNINPLAANRLGSKQSEESIKKAVSNNPRVLPVIQFDFNGNLISEYYSTGEAERATGLSRIAIYSCCKHQQEYTGNFFFIYKEEYKEYKEYFESLKESPFVPQIWNKGLHFRADKEKSLILFDRYGRYVDTFSYQTDVAKFIGCTTSNLCNCKNKKPCKNYLLFDLTFDYSSFIEKVREENYFVYTLNRVPGHIMMYDNFGNFISGFDSVEEAADVTSLVSNSIYCVLCGKRKQIKGYVFKYYDDIV